MKCFLSFCLFTVCAFFFSSVFLARRLFQYVPWSWLSHGCLEHTTNWQLPSPSPVTTLLFVSARTLRAGHPVPSERCTSTSLPDCDRGWGPGENPGSGSCSLPSHSSRPGWGWLCQHRLRHPGRLPWSAQQTCQEAQWWAGLFSLCLSWIYAWMLHVYVLELFMERIDLIVHNQHFNSSSTIGSQLCWAI